MCLVLDRAGKLLWANHTLVALDVFLAGCVGCVVGCGGGVLELARYPLFVW